MTEGFDIEMPAPLDEDFAADVAKQAVYASRGVARFRWDEQRRTARIELTPDADPREVEDKARRLVTLMVARHRRLPKKVLQTRLQSEPAALVADIEEQLAQHGFLRQLGPGQMGLAGPALSFARALDARVSRLARSRFGAREEAFPGLIPTEILHRCGYFGSFPQSVSLVTHLNEDFDAIERFRKANGSAASLAIPEPSALSHPSACLSPAVCYHLYPALKGMKLEAPVTFFTASGRCFRYESKNVSGLERLWEFGMREVIYLGAEAEVTRARETLMEVASEQATELDLDFVIESANDPFFSAAYAEKSYWQSRNDLKLELRLLVPGPPGHRIAAASFNLHESFFGRTFGFTANDGEPAFTGCAGWGLERWVLAAFARHGLDAAKWPASWRDDIFG